MRDEAPVPPSADALVTIEDEFGAHNYDPIDVVLTSGEGIWVTDVEGATYIDALSAYSSLNLGHRHPRILAALAAQAGRLAITSRAFRNDQLPLFCEELAKLCGLDVVLPMNTGTEAVETAIKASRRWGVRTKKIREPKIVVCENNFHGRSTTIIGFSSDESYRRDFGPFTPGFISIPYDDVAALERALTDDVCAFLVEPIQAEAGIIVPKSGYIRRAAELCKQRGVLFVADEIQTGLARTGKLFAVDYDDVKPDLLILGKALGGGVYPVSAVVGRREVMDVFDPGSHGSTWGGNPLACAIAREAIRVIVDENLAQAATERGDQLTYELADMRSRNIVEIRGQGLLLGIELKVPARKYCEALAEAGVLTKETHSHVIRICPPLIISEEDVEELAERIAEGFAAAESG
ncbi:MAG TPA: ornithine--oxo-acid transaminase [Candidatus Acidoferrales bacterium]|nr:ornithine--oxo-acid transaminase [Candidatus Acidoferrales bacterium]